VEGAVATALWLGPNRVHTIVLSLTRRCAVADTEGRLKPCLRKPLLCQGTDSFGVAERICPLDFPMGQR